MRGRAAPGVRDGAPGMRTQPSAATLRLLVLALDYEEPGLVAIVRATLEDMAACVAVVGGVPWATPADAAGRSAALLKAAKVGSPRICKVLVLAGADANQIIDGGTFSRLSATQGATSGWTPLFFAAREGHVGTVAVLLAAPGVDPSRANLYGDTPLYTAAQNGHADVAALLLARPGVDPSRTNLNGATPLHAAARNGHAGVAALLLASPGVDPSQATDGGCTPLFLACVYNHPAVAALLLDHGADWRATTSSGDTALSYARQNTFPPELLRQLELLCGVGWQGQGPQQPAAHQAGHGEPGTAAAEQAMLEWAITLSLHRAGEAGEACGGSAVVEPEQDAWMAMAIGNLRGESADAPAPALAAGEENLYGGGGGSDSFSDTDGEFDFSSGSEIEDT